MNSRPCNLVACTYSQINLYTYVINKNAIEYETWIKLPSEFGKEFVLYEVKEISPLYKELDFLHVIEHVCCKPWLKAISSGLNLDPGQHVYKLSFINKFNNNISSLYISYIIQDDNPDKPYVYMDRD